MKLTPAQIKKYNKIADAGKKPIMVRVGSKWYTWYEGDPKYGVFLTTQSGKDVEFDFKQIDDIQEGVEKLTKSKLREIIREELLKEQALNEYQVDLSQMAVRLGEFSKILKGYQRRTTDPKWEKQLNSVIKDLNRLEDKFHNISRKLGIIPLK